MKRKFNPHPEDAPKIEPNKVHFMGSYNTGSWKHTVEHLDTRVRYFLFKIGRSEKTYSFHDKYLDNKALTLLKKNKDKRLVLQGYFTPSAKGPAFFGIITAFGIHHRLSKGYMVINPDTGEENSFYKLRTA